MVIGVPIPKTYTQCKFLNRFKSVNLTLLVRRPYSGSVLQFRSNTGKIEFQHCGIVGIFVALAIEDAHLLPSFATHFCDMFVPRKVG